MDRRTEAISISPLLFFKKREKKRGDNDQREITPKISRAKLWFLCMTHCLNVL